MKYLNNKIILIFILFAGLFFTSCSQDNLDPDNAPAAGEVSDLTPPEAGFSFIQDVEDFTIFLFVNESTSATGQTWSIPEDAVLVGDEASLTDSNISVKFSGEGEFNVGLVASDNLPNFSEELVEIIEVIEPEVPLIPTPVIIAPGFENTDEIADGRNPWGRDNSENVDYKNVLGLNIFGTSSGSRVRSGEASAKFEDVDLRQAYQEIQVTPNVDYRVSIYIKIGDDFDLTLVDENEMRLAILGETFETYDAALFEGAILASVEADPREDFAKIFVDFNSGDLETVVIFMDSKGTIEVQVDDVEIAVL